MNYQKTSDGIFIIFSILVPLLLGAYVYIYWDTDSYFGNAARALLMIPEIEKSIGVTKIIRNWGCDFLFAYALFYALYASTKQVFTAIECAAICSVGLELLQLIKVDFLKSGTFDVVDIIVEIAAICFGATALSCYNHIKIKRGGKEP